MRTLTTCIVIATIVCFIAQPAVAQNNKLPGWQWLKGKWAMQLKAGTAYEIWHYVNDSCYKSESYIVKASGDTIPQENVMLVYRNNEMFYIPTVNGQNNGQAVSFKITSAKAHEFVAENPEHDFPQRIIYMLKDATHLYARIEGMNKGKFEKEEYEMKRVE
jgi:hypothetical protein